MSESISAYSAVHAHTVNYFSQIYFYDLQQTMKKRERKRGKYTERLPVGVWEN
jgi:hypothetical protein